MIDPGGEQREGKRIRSKKSEEGRKERRKGEFLESIILMNSTISESRREDDQLVGATAGNGVRHRARLDIQKLGPGQTDNQRYVQDATSGMIGWLLSEHGSFG